MFCLCPLNNKLDQELHLSSFKKKGQELHIEKLILSIFDLKKKNQIQLQLHEQILLFYMDCK